MSTPVSTTETNTEPTIEQLVNAANKDSADAHRAASHATLLNAADSARNVALGVGIGVIGAILAYGRVPALGFVLFVALLLGGLFLSARAQNITPVRRNLPILIPLLFFAAMFAIRSEQSLAFYNLLAGTFAALLLIFYFRSGNIAQHDLFGYTLTSMLTSLAIIIQPFDDLFKTRKWLAHRTFHLQAIMPVIRGLLITIPVVGVFVILFSSADAVFSKLVSDIFSRIRFPNVYDLGGYATFAMTAGWAAIGGISFALAERKSKRGEASMTADLFPTNPPVLRRPLFGLGFTETTMLLGSVCAVFGAFVAIQFVYLFGGVRNIEKFSYADYVHRGFAELVIVGILTLGLAYTLNHVAVRKTRYQTNTFRFLATLLLVLTGVILVSAFQRLRLYEAAYGVTSLRLLIYVFIVWLGVLFAGFTLSLYWQPPMVNLFGVTTLVAFFGFVATLDIINPDAFVARTMIERADVDPLYLVSLSNEAIPSMVLLIDAPEPGLRDMVRRELGERQMFLKDTHDLRDLSLGRANALAAIASVSDKIIAPSGRSAYTSLTEDDLKFLKLGMNYRKVLRQFGRPTFTTYFGSFERDFSDPDSLQIRYTIEGGQFHQQQVAIWIDSTTGVDKMCIIHEASYTTCVKTLLD